MLFSGLVNHVSMILCNVFVNIVQFSPFYVVFISVYLSCWFKFVLIIVYCIDAGFKLYYITITYIQITS